MNRKKKRVKDVPIFHLRGQRANVPKVYQFFYFACKLANFSTSLANVRKGVPIF